MANRVTFTLKLWQYTPVFFNHLLILMMYETYKIMFTQVTSYVDALEASSCIQNVQFTDRFNVMCYIHASVVYMGKCKLQTT
jgi:hypothetical protein